MKKLLSQGMIALVLGFTLFGTSPVQAEEHHKPIDFKDVELSEQQKGELEKLHKDMLQTNKQLIQKYIEFGIVSKEKGEKIITHMDSHFNHMKENGFIPKWDKHHHRKDDKKQ
ncbi:YckD family protein [Tuberibacillus sp. Marseille-P3662]|uniref:YckD family protein n=1 Tax=Tuberibacillus sp. Marseille-P3662 TaxID=1965358 RepID=UPI000A1C8993|nr:YckD family protein [Tuberibacillus sp. Marseille-P3662]